MWLFFLNFILSEDHVGVGVGGVGGIQRRSYAAIFIQDYYPKSYILHILSKSLKIIPPKRIFVLSYKTKIRKIL